MSNPGNLRRFTLATSALVALACGSPPGATEQPNVTSDLGGNVSAIRIEAENYRNGGEGVAYHDTTSSNLGGAYRRDAVDIRASRDVGGGYQVGWMAAGEWLTWDVTVPEATLYTFTARLSSGLSGIKQFTLSVDGADVGTLSFSDAPGWDTFFSRTVGSIQLASGPHVVKLTALTNGFDLNYMDVSYGTGAKGLVFGMYDSAGLSAQGDSTANFRAITDKYLVPAKFKVRRSFNSPASFPDDYSMSAAAHDAALGITSFLSVKPPNGDVQGVIQGHYDARITVLCASMPAGSYLTMYHEPENDMPGQTFSAMFTRFHSVCKAANSKIFVGYVSMAYQWRPGSPTTATPDDWWMGATNTDFLGTDTYIPKWNRQSSLATDPEFARWYQWASAKNVPLVIPEFGVEGSETGGMDDATRGAVIKASLDYLHASTRIEMVLYWNGTPTQYPQQWSITPSADDPQAHPQSLQAWVDAINAYGSTGTNISGR